jgi:uncharacterized membrane protein
MAEDSKTFAALCAALTWIGFIIAIVAKKDDSYVMYYGKQGLALTILVLILGAISFTIGLVITVLMFIPGVNIIVGLLSLLLIPLYLIVMLAIIALWILGIVNALSGQKKSLPLVGMIADKLPL